MTVKFEATCGKMRAYALRLVMPRKHPTKVLPGNLQLTCDLKSIILSIHLGLFCSLLMIISVYNKIIIHLRSFPHSSLSLPFHLLLYSFLLVLLLLLLFFFFFFFGCAMFFDKISSSTKRAMATHIII